MKKLIMLAVVAVAATVVQAATINWSVKGLTDSKGSTLSTGNAWVFSNGTGTYKTPDALTTALSDLETAAAFDTFITKNAISGMGSSVSGGEAGQTGLDLTNTGLPQSSTGAKYSQKVFVLVTDTATITDATKWYVTQYSAGTTIPKTTASTTASFAITDTGSATASNWKSIGGVIPEPTSGILLLVGVAGLALKRRRA